MSVVIVLLAACSTDNGTSYTQNAVVQYHPGNSATTEQVTPDDTPIADQTPETESNTTQEEVPLADTFDFYFRGTLISLNQNMAEVLEALGEPSGMRQTPSCAFDGYDRIFGYGAINIHTYPAGDKDFVQIVSIRDDSITTRNGIRLGDRWDMVREAYGNDYAQDFNIFTFMRGNTTLSFFVADDIVLEITYGLIID